MAGGRDKEAFGTTVITPSEAPVKVDPDGAVDLDGGAFGDRYDGLQTLARGGMGEVRLVRDRRIGRDVAVKVMVPERKLSDELRARFLREARVQGQLEHPAIVPVYDIGRDEHGNEYFTMRRLNGWTLEQILNRLRDGNEDAARKWTQQSLLGAFQQVCLAVDYAHNHGVIHRDIKPANIMLGKFGEVYLLDWGLAKLREVITAQSINETVSGSSPTTEGQLLGTPGYMAPEQAAGEADVDERADVYGLGAVLFEILALVPLHEGNSAKALLRSTHVGANARISERAPDRDVAPELDAVCERAVALEQADRFDSARDLHDAIQRVLDGQQDLSLRKRLADKHANAARAALDCALAGGDDEANQRSAALSEIGQALALRPDDPAVSRMLAVLLTTAPAQPPKDAEVAQVSARRSEVTSISHAALAALGLFGVILIACPLWMGIQDWRWIGAVAVPLVLAVVSLLRLRSAGPDEVRLALVATILAGFAIAATAGFGGALILTPGIAVILTILPNSSTGGVGQSRWSALFIGCLTVVVPFSLEWAGVLPTVYTFANDTLIVDSSIVHMTEVPVRISALLTILMSIAIPTMFVWEISKTNARLRSELLVQKWHFQQLVPRPAADAS